MQHLLPCSVLKCSQDTKVLVLLLMSFLQSQNNFSMDKVVNKTGLMLGGCKIITGRRSVCRPPYHLHICTDVFPRAATCQPSLGHSGSEGVTVPRAVTAKLTALVSQLLLSQHLHCRPSCPVTMTLQKPVVSNVFSRFKV